jgi:hypothetical protein
MLIGMIAQSVFDPLDKDRRLDPDVTRCRLGFRSYPMIASRI